MPQQFWLGLGHYESEVVVTWTSRCAFFAWLTPTSPIKFAARVIKSTPAVAFVEGELRHAARPADPPFATLTAMVAPA